MSRRNTLDWADNEQSVRVSAGILTNQVHYAKGTHMSVEVAHVRAVLLALSQFGDFNIPIHNLKAKP